MVTARAIRHLWTLLLGVILWVGYARTAEAAAPLCDKRGATTFAPAPQLQAPESSIDLGLPTCDAPESFDQAQRPGQEDHRIGDLESSDPAHVGPLSVDVIPPSSAGVTRDPIGGAPRAALTSRVERPPRTA